MKTHYTQLLDEKKTATQFFKYKYYFLLLPVILATFLLLILNVGVEITFQSHEIHFSWNTINGKYVDLNEKGYFIKTEGCTIPAFDAFDPSIRKFVHPAKKFSCHNTKNPPLIDSNHTSLWVVEKYLQNYKVVDSKNLKCCYQPFYRPEGKTSTSDDRFKYIKECTPFVNSTDIKHEFIKVVCSYNNSVIYKDFHSFVILKNKDLHKFDKSNPKFNVLMLGIDAVSRLNFHRTMPQTLKFLQSMGASEFKGYNKVGDNTYPNLVPVLSGLSEKDFNAGCITKKSSTFDKCPLIWKKYSEAGHFTAFAEDAAHIALFNYLKNGFSGKPTDFYWRTFDYLAEKEIGHEKHLNAKLCLGPRLVLEVLLSYVYKFTKTLSEHQYFGFFWETSLTHDYLNYPLIGDEKYLNLLKRMHSDGLLNRTVVVVLSDHGIRWGEIRSTHQGRMEERLPFLFFVLPEIFKERFPLASSNLRRNTKRLTTPFDLHETLRDLLNLSEIENDKIRQKSAEGSYANKRGISLFLPVNENRTCDSASIAPHWCTCHETKRLDVDDKKVLNVARIVVDHINSLLTNYVQCAKLVLDKIVDATLGRPSDSLEMHGVSHIVEDYTVVVKTSPGFGMFEATVRHTVSGWNVTGTVSRINLYGKQSYCVDNFHLKLYCFCDSPFSKYKIFR